MNAEGWIKLHRKLLDNPVTMKDTLFIGDSRTVGLYEYGGLEQTADFCATTGLTVYKLFQENLQ